MLQGKLRMRQRENFQVKGKRILLQILLYILVQILFRTSEKVHNAVEMNTWVEMFQIQSLKSRFAAAVKKWDRQHGHQVCNLYREERSAEIEGGGQHLNDSSGNVEVGDSEDNRDILGNGGEDGDISENGEVTGNSGNDGESEENRGEIGIERGRVDSMNSGNEVGNENNRNSLDTGSGREDSGNSVNNGPREDDGGNLNENAVDRCIEGGNSGNERADSGENGNRLSDEGNGNVVDRLGEDENGDNSHRDNNGWKSIGLDGERRQKW